MDVFLLRRPKVPSSTSKSGSDSTTINLKMGETAKTTKREVTVYSAQKSNTYTWRGSSGNVYTEAAPAGKTYIMVNVQIKNIGSDSLYASASDFSIADPNGYKYDQKYASIDNELKSQELFQNQ